MSSVQPAEDRPSGNVEHAHCAHDMTFENLWNRLSFDHKAGFLVWPSLAGQVLSDRERELIAQYAPWGFTFFGRNLSSLSQGARLLGEVRHVLAGARGDGLPLGFFSMDEEGGRVSRLPAPFPKTPSARALAEAGEEALRSHTLMRAGVARTLGFNMIFAPVCDVLSNPGNGVIGDRAFGTDPETVGRCAALVSETLLASGVCPVLKHFPSHGGTLDDTHRTTARSVDPADVVRERDLAVYRELIGRGAAPAVMTCHVVFEAFDSSQPATLSKVLLSDVLRRELGFTGLVLSDDLRMNAIAERFGLVKEQEVAAASDELSRVESAHRAAVGGGVPASERYLGEAACAALIAGCDAVLCCRGIEREASVLEAVSAALRLDGGGGGGGGSGVAPGGFSEVCRLRARQVFEASWRFSGLASRIVPNV